MKKLLIVGLLIAICIVISPVLAATITTDKPDYAPEETVILYGTGFAEGNPVYIIVTRPNGDTEKYSVEPYPVIPDASGTFTAYYQLDGIQGTYVVEATDSTGLAVQTTFNDMVPVPEFPSAFLPTTMIIGFLGAVLLIQRTRKH
jgi:hypothetical protein